MNLKVPALSERTSFDWIRALVLILTLLTGFTALIYEVVWQRYLANLLGSQAKATALILAVFLGGLSVGYAVFGRVSCRWSAKRLVLIYGLAEIAIGLWATFFPEIYQLLWTHWGVVDPHRPLAVLFDLAAAVALIGLPTILMGGTLPLLTQALSRDIQDSAPFHARLYAINTAGAFFGTLYAGFHALPTWGLAGTMRTVGPINIIAGAIIALIVSRSMSRNSVTAPVGESSHGVLRRVQVHAMLIGFLAGFVSLTLQTVFIRLIGLSMGSSEYAFAMVVAVFVAMLALGAWSLSAEGAERKSLVFNQLFVFVGALLVYLSISYWPYATHVIRTMFTSYDPTFYVYYATMFVVLSLVLAIPVGAMGRTLPMAFITIRNTFGDLGVTVGKVYAANTFGCVLGATLGGYYCLYLMNLDKLFRINLSIVGLTVLLAYPLAATKRNATLTALVGLVLMVAPTCLPNWNQAYLVSGLFRYPNPTAYSYDGPKPFYESLMEGTKLLAYWDDPNTTVSISERETDKDAALNNGALYVRSIRVNGKSDGETSYSDMRTMRLTAHLPGLLSPIPIRRVGVVGFGLGVTVGSMSLYPEVEDIHVMEISPAVQQFSPYFDFANYSVSKNPKVRWSIGDAYRTLAASPEKYSVIISEPSNPWVTGVERLFARDFYQLVKQRLEPGGIYAQWIHYYTLSTETLSLVVNTFSKSFPHVRVFRTQRDMIILASENPLGTESLQALERRYQAVPAVRAALQQISLSDAASVLGTELWVRRESLPSSEEQTLEFPKLSFRAGRDFFRGDDVNLRLALDTTPGRMWGRSAAEGSLIRGWLRLSENKEDAFLSYTKTACDMLVPHFYPNWKHELKNCRDALVALSIGGAIKPSDGLEAEEVSLLRRFRDDVPIDSWLEALPKLQVKDAQRLIGLFTSYDSIFSQLSVERLLIAATPCLKEKSAEAFQCRAMLVDALCVGNYPKLAREVIDTLLQEDTADAVSPGRKIELQQLAETALQTSASRDFWAQQNTQ